MSMRALVPSILVLGFVACATTQVPMPSPQQAESAAHRWPGTTQEDLVAGRAIYVEKCSGCHTLPLPESKSADAWPKVIDEMADRSKLSQEDRTRVLRYLVTVSPSAVTAKR
jgi:hypothetical protein